ncbi:E3 ubiquitin-protein ligase TRIM47-like [Erpetoichthys calabaricus]|uniref:E3 ubiquitin-protein ligase TRIM47-like n=1 Tax=Erpetoichthys calabaricus TaxID=27687 RepID=UPI0022348315|nr:E3 ubiquitin-protein ligase TRIM47-like [Erpetoichthys calabaricus]
MAAAQLPASVDQHTCSACLVVLQDLVAIPCGHSFCMVCIDVYWKQSGTEGIYTCHQCRQTFDLKPPFNRNATLADVTATLKGVLVSEAPSQSYAGPDDVPCDVCTGRKLRAEKTCSSCMHSYCETHLRPHRESEDLKTHKLEEPSGSLKDKLCTKHQKVLESFCRTDEICVCLLCEEAEHNGHEMVTPDMERSVRQSLLENRMAEMKKRIEEKEKKLEETKETVVRIQSSAKREVQEHEESFASLLQSIERLRSEISCLIRDYEQREVRKAEALMGQLKNEIKELKRRDADLDEFSKTDNHIYFLKRFPSIFSISEDADAPIIAVNSDFLPDTLRKDLSDLKKTLEEISDWEFMQTSDTGLNYPGHILQYLRGRNYFLKCNGPVVPNTDLHPGLTGLKDRPPDVIPPKRKGAALR